MQPNDERRLLSALGRGAVALLAAATVSACDAASLKPRCASSADCASGESCTDGRCVPNEGSDPDAGAVGAADGGAVGADAGACVVAAPSSTGSHAYFEMLAARPDCHLAHPLRSQTEIDAMTTRSRDSRKHPTIYDSAHDAMLQRSAGDTPTNAEQKIARVTMGGGASALIVWDFKIGSSLAWQGEGFLEQFKAYRFDYAGGEFYMAVKHDYQRAARQGRGIAEMFVSSKMTFLGPGTTNSNSEILEPRLTEFYVEPDTWTRYWMFFDGAIGGAEPVELSVWAADENREPIHIYDRILVNTPEGTGMDEFRFEFNTSDGMVLNDTTYNWSRNLVVLKGVDLDSVRTLLVRPVR